MKTVISSQLALITEDTRLRHNVLALLRYLGLVVVTIIIFTILFQVIMITVEGQSHSWVSALYWTLTTMSTLGYGDITFQTDFGRIYSMVVLVSGVIMLLVVLPFAFIRFFYAPWLEAQIHNRAPRSVPEKMKGHVLICRHDNITPGLIRRLEQDKTPYYVIESDSGKAADLHAEGISVVQGDIDSEDTFRALNLKNARVLIANAEDTLNTTIILTARNVAPDVEIIAICNYEESVDVLELSGANHVLPLKQWLGEQLANRVSASHTKSHIIGTYEDLAVAELPAHHTPLAGLHIHETTIRKSTGVNIIGLWQRGEFVPVYPDMKITDQSVLVLIGTEDQLEDLDEILAIYDSNPNPVLLVGAGRVGRAVARALYEKGVPVNLIEKQEMLCRKIDHCCNKVIAGDAADYELLVDAGVKEAPTTILTTHDDSMNVFLTSYCRRLNPEMRIVSRITRERNLSAIHSAGADFVMSYASYSVDVIFSLLMDKEFIILGEGVDLFPIQLPDSLIGMTLAESDIGKKTGLNVIAIRENGVTKTQLSASTTMHAGSELLVVGSTDQRETFFYEFGHA